MEHDMDVNMDVKKLEKVKFLDLAEFPEFSPTKSARAPRVVVSDGLEEDYKEWKKESRDQTITIEQFKSIREASSSKFPRRKYVRTIDFRVIPRIVDVASFDRFKIDLTDLTPADALVTALYNFDPRELRRLMNNWELKGGRTHRPESQDGFKMLFEPQDDGEWRVTECLMLRTDTRQGISERKEISLYHGGTMVSGSGKEELSVEDARARLREWSFPAGYVIIKQPWKCEEWDVLNVVEARSREIKRQA
ncbi:hypothetical protein NA57DRAFT_61896 [Rhizodiscina lignyota]|uniref:Uncharacterized protein n=1 Tax=Rhizodiscina lignyota TaxID=1504668 RepID=A0A9P4LZY0_9PEZI|nr:hypothetical protein NA57DRAFT_61896 [Rhizodiscina lignyota]